MVILRRFGIPILLRVLRKLGYIRALRDPSITTKKAGFLNLGEQFQIADKYGTRLGQLCLPPPPASTRLEELSSALMELGNTWKYLASGPFDFQQIRLRFFASSRGMECILPLHNGTN
jgi:hypothetical protein